MSEYVSEIGLCQCFSLEHIYFDPIAARGFQECLFTWNERASFYVGMLSLVFWVLCQMPQFVTNYRNKSADALAPMLLAQWLLGDTLNLLGAVLTHQLAFQRISAALFVTMDLMMIAQKLYYSRRNLTQISTPSSTQPLLFIAMILAMTSLPQAAAHEKPLVLMELNLIESCEEELNISHSKLIMGNILGWTSTVFYVGSRLPQIMKNRRRKSTEGISDSMFVFAVLGNFTYSGGILLRNDHVVRSIPWLLGSLACMTLDITLVAQVWYYHPTHMRVTDEVPDNTETDEDDQSSRRCCF